MALSKLKKIWSDGDNEEEVTPEEEFYSVSKEEYHVENGMANSKMMLLEPRAYSESQQITDNIKQRSAVVVNLKRVTPDQAKRIVDFLSGTIYAIGKKKKKLGGGIFLCTPNNVKVAGKISEEANNASSANKNVKAKKDKEDSDEDDFF